MVFKFKLWPTPLRVAVNYLKKNTFKRQTIANSNFSAWKFYTKYTQRRHRLVWDPGQPAPLRAPCWFFKILQVHVKMTWLFSGNLCTKIIHKKLPSYMPPIDYNKYIYFNTNFRLEFSQYVVQEKKLKNVQKKAPSLTFKARYNQSPQVHPLILKNYFSALMSKFCFEYFILYNW